MKKIFDVKQLSYVGIMTSINIVFILLNLFIPSFALLIYIGIPLLSCLVKIKCDFKYILIYLISSLILGVLIDFQTCLFYLIPSLLTGTLFGVLIQKEVHSFYIIILTSLLNSILQFVSIYLINIIYGVNMFDVFSKIFNLNDNTFKDISLSFVYLIGFIQSIFSYIIIEGESNKFNIKINEDKSLFLSTSTIGFIFSISGFILNLFIKSASNLAICTSLIYALYLISYFIKIKSIPFKIILYTFIIAGVLLTILNIDYLKQQGLYLIFNIFSLVISLSGLIFNIFMLVFKKHKITNDYFSVLKGEVDKEEIC